MRAVANSTATTAITPARRSKSWNHAGGAAGCCVAVGGGTSSLPALRRARDIRNERNMYRQAAGDVGMVPLSTEEGGAHSSQWERDQVPGRFPRAAIAQLPSLLRR